MRSNLRNIAILGLICLQVALASRHQRVIVEKDPNEGQAPHGWVELERQSRTSEETLKLTFALKQRNLKHFEDLFWEISDPNSKQYRNFLSHKQIRKLIAPSEEEVQLVKNYLERSGASNVQLHDSGDFLTAEISVADAESMLDTVFKQYHHPTSNTRFMKAHMSYSLPAEIASKVDFVSGFRFPNVASKFKSLDTFEATKAAMKLPLPELNGPMPANGSVLVFRFTLGNAAYLIFIPRCKNGELTNTSPNLCSDVGGPQIISIDITAYQEGTPEKYSPYADVNIAQECASCSQATGFSAYICPVMTAYYGISQDTVFCSTLINDLDNYAKTVIDIGLTFDDADSTNALQENLPFWVTEYVTPQYIQRLYGVPAGTVVKSSRTSQSVAQFLGQYYSPTDLASFYELMSIPPSEINVVGPNNASNPGGEATLDIQFITGVAPLAATTFWSTGGLVNGQEPFLQWIFDVINSPNAAQIQSISYADDEKSLTSDYMNRLNVEFQKAGAVGMSLFFAAGDTGVYSGASTSGSPFISCDPFTPYFPPSSPYVTAVGGTMLSTQITPICSEQSVMGSVPIDCFQVGERTSSTAVGSSITTGGGTSNVFPLPDYQVNNPAVQNYINSLHIPVQYWNTTGRVYPDISALAHNYLTVTGGNLSPVDGTSAATPASAAIFTLLTDQLNLHGQAAFGFLNPLLYQIAANNATAFTDIVMGDNSCNENALACCPYGYPAALGYDAVTGLGTPRYDELLKVIKELFDF
eukprot:TRINITY_DN6700_c0_g1_i1.p1 TRINITY_DN6700_c0_g1~~TRINITY_DN6700_c0_g1_i1.p1  ORF type:complete len:755 (-),score=176.12 TRINITY_DN6700_c0_g1_i1:27-2291(-)